MPTDRLGIKCKAYRNTATYASPTWSELTLVSDFQIGGAWQEADASTRESRIALTAKTLLGLEVTGKLKVRPGDTNYDAVRDAFYDPEGVLDMLVMEDGDNATEGNTGVRFDAQVTNFALDQGLQTVLFRDLTLKPTGVGGNDPQSAVVGAAAAITYTPLGT